MGQTRHRAALGERPASAGAYFVCVKHDIGLCSEKGRRQPEPIFHWSNATSGCDRRKAGVVPRGHWSSAGFVPRGQWSSAGAVPRGTWSSFVAGDTGPMELSWLCVTGPMELSAFAILHALEPQCLNEMLKTLCLQTFWKLRAHFFHEVGLAPKPSACRYFEQLGIKKTRKHVRFFHEVGLTKWG